jgi:hypothetical protein
MKKLFYVFITLAIMATTKQQCYAQLFTKTKLPATLNAKQEEMLAKIYKNPDTKNVDFVNIKSPKVLNLANRKIDFSFEESGIEKVSVDVRRLEFEANGDYVWFGQLLGADFVQLLLIKKEENVFGLLEYNDRVFQIYGLGEGVSVMIEQNALAEKANTCRPILPSEGKGSITSNTGNTPEIINPCAGYGVNIIVFFTSKALAITPDIAQFAETCVQTYNTSLIGNGSIAAANNGNNFLVLKGAELLSGFIERKNNMLTDLIEFNSDPTANSRQSNPSILADLKVLITDAEHDDILGLAFTGAEVGSSSAVVERRFAFGSGGIHTFAHEVGHLFKGNHDLDDEPNPRPGFTSGFNHAISVDVNYGWFGPSNKRFATVLYSPASRNGKNVGGSRKWENILNFSSPSQSVSGATLGNSTCCNNTRAILDHAPTVRNITRDATLSVGLIGDYWITNYRSYYLEPVINCGAPPFTSEWQMFVNGSLVTTQTLPNDTQFSFYANDSDIPDGSSVEIFLKVTSSNNQVAYAYRYMAVSYVDYNDLIDPTTERTLGKKVTQTTSIYPNPVVDKFIFEYNVETPSTSDFSIFNSNGALMQHTKVDNSAGHFYQKFDVSTMSTGMYMLKALINKKMVTQKFSISR